MVGVVTVSALVRYAITEPWRTFARTTPPAPRVATAPDAFELPRYPEAQVIDRVKVPRGAGSVSTTVFEIDSRPGEIERWYRAELGSRGWRVSRVTLPEEVDEPAQVLVAVKHNRRLEISWIERKDRSLRVVSETLTEPEQAEVPISSRSAPTPPTSP